MIKEDGSLSIRTATITNSTDETSLKNSTMDIDLGVDGRYVAPLDTDSNGYATLQLDIEVADWA